MAALALEATRSSALGQASPCYGAQKVQTDSLRAETLRRSTTGATLAPRGTVVRRLATRIDSIGLLCTGPVGTPPPAPPPPPVVTAAWSIYRVGGVTPEPGVALPRTWLTDQAYPVAGCTVVVPLGADEQLAINAARGGDEVCLAVGDRPRTTALVLPARPDTGYVVVRSVPTAGQPGPWVRMLPSMAPTVARIRGTRPGPVLRTGPGARGWVLQHLEITADSFTAGGTLVELGRSGQPLAEIPSHLMLDRVLIRPHPGHSLHRCVSLQSAATIVANSSILDCHGRSLESQAIAGWDGPGPYRIANTELQGSGQALLIGGAPPTHLGVMPADIELVRNYFHTPASWRGRWTMKTTVELKFGRRVYMDANVIDGAWVDAQPLGAGLMLKVDNNPDAGRIERWVTLRDVTIRRTAMRNVGSGLSLTGVEGSRAPYVDSLASRIAIVGMVIDSIGVGAPYPGVGAFVASGIDSLRIDSLVIGPVANVKSFLSMDATVAKVRAFAFTNTVTPSGQYGAFTGGSSEGTASLAAAITTLTWQNVTIVGPDKTARYPASTRFVPTEASEPLAAQIRASVLAATAGVVRP